LQDAQDALRIVLFQNSKLSEKREQQLSVYNRKLEQIVQVLIQIKP